MHDAVFQALFVWHAALVAALVVWAARGAWVFRPAVAVDAMGPVFVGAIALVAIHRGEAWTLEIALAVALLAFVQTVVVARAVERTRAARRCEEDGDARDG